jgi:preprotein translocase subunit SecG
MDIINLLQIFIAVALIAVILMQNRGAGMSGLFGGTGNVYASKRGLEKKLFYATIVLSVSFFVVSLFLVIF